MRIIARLVEIDRGIADKGIHRNAIGSAARLEASMRRNEPARIVIITEVPRERGPTHSDLNVPADFQMQMRVVEPVRRAHGSDLLPPSHGLSAMNEQTD